MANKLTVLGRAYFRENYLVFCLSFFLFVLALFARTLPGPRTIDDSFITYRYARNILAGNGFVYNPGEHVLGTTTPLYTLMLTVFASATGGVDADFPSIAMIFNAIADGLTCVLLFLLGNKLKSPIAGFGAGLAWAIAPFSVTFAIGGLETSVYVLLLVGTTFCYINNRYVQAAFLSALAILTRPDAVLLVFPLVIDRSIDYLRYFRNSARDKAAYPKITPLNPQKTKPEISKEIAAFIVPLGLWIIFSSAYFGSPLPHSIAAKSLAYRLPADAGFIRLLQHYATIYMDNLSFGTPAIGVGMVLYPILYCFGALFTSRVTRKIWPFLIYPWVYMIVFSIANPLIFRWYLTPPLPSLFLITLIGAESTIRKLTLHFGNRIYQQDPNKVLLTANVISILVVVISPFLMLLRGWTLHPDHGLSRPAPQMAWYQLELLYKKAADDINRDLRDRNPPTLLAAGDVGVLGYNTGATILDTVGLNSPLSVKYYPTDPKYYVINYAIPPELILDAQPNYLVILEVYGREGLLKNELFRSMYHLRNKIPTDVYGSDGLLIFEKK